MSDLWERVRRHMGWNEDEIRSYRESIDDE